MLKFILSIIIIWLLVLCPIYYAIRKAIATIQRKTYNNFIDKKLDHWLISCFEKAARKKDEDFKKTAAQVAAIIRILIYAVAWLWLVYLTPSLLAIA